MSKNVRPRDAGLQPERTALAWQRTVFTVLIFSLAAVRVALSRGDIVSGALSGAGIILLLMMAISYRRQQTLINRTDLSTLSSALAKGLISAALCLVSLSFALPALLNLMKGEG
ncbi:DUF202 domain-containing protein [Erwinia oleae]|uniref:DUF202 domain-containing protein n=1 Tax=Erwinia oleae TaxID=796334 RepID=UPI0005541594|nr:DUF202 domain-containing protein [Erwinia oleae]